MYDELIKRLRDLQSITEHCGEQSCGECENRELCDKYDNKTLSGTYKEVADAIEELQKAVPKSGVWREEECGYDDVYYECSVCGAGICTVDGDPVDNAWSYCPECGAKMTGVERLPEPPEEE